MNLKQAKEALAKYQATHGNRWHIYIAPPPAGVLTDVEKLVITQQGQWPEGPLNGRADLDLVFVERSKIHDVMNNGGAYFTQRLHGTLGAPKE